jgi:hypothetical protein
MYDCTLEEDEDGERRRAGGGVAVGVGQYEETHVVADTDDLPGRTRQRSRSENDGGADLPWSPASPGTRTGRW